VAPDSSSLASSFPAPAQSKQPHRPTPDHPWRTDKWPTREAWKWA
jgi:hypothetical protein